MSDQTKQQETRSLPATFAKNEFEKDAFILRQLVTKDCKIKYRRSVLGVAWSVLNPLLMMIVINAGMAIRELIRNKRIAAGRDAEEPVSGDSATE